MKNSVKILLHAGFWMIFPIFRVISVGSREFGTFSYMMGTDQVSFWSLLSDSFRFLTEPPDMGAYFLSGSNLFGIIFNFYLYILLPVGIFYACYFLLKPHNLKGQIFKLLTIIILPFIITTIFKYLTIRVGFEFPYFLVMTGLFAIPFATFGLLFRKMEVWITHERRTQENLKSELALLKNQISPHFLFNTLNNIDSLIKTNADQASETLIKLSGIMRYMIYDTNAGRVPLSLEIKHIEDYIDLQKIQFSNRELVSFNVSGDTDRIQIAPMLFIPFVENAFKHCTDKNTRNAIRFSFRIEGNTVIFESSNIFNEEQKISRDHAGGIGLKNIKRRLELLYPDSHFLNFIQENSTFKVNLTVKINGR